MAATHRLPRSVHDLEQEFAGLADQIPDSPAKRAISVRHGIVLALWRDADGERSTADAAVR
jgi:hypothetical protein